MYSSMYFTVSVRMELYLKQNYEEEEEEKIERERERETSLEDGFQHILHKTCLLEKNIKILIRHFLVFFANRLLNKFKKNVWKKIFGRKKNIYIYI